MAKRTGKMTRHDSSIRCEMCCGPSVHWYALEPGPRWWCWYCWWPGVTTCLQYSTVTPPPGLSLTSMRPFAAGEGSGVVPCEYTRVVKVAINGTDGLFTQVLYLYIQQEKDNWPSSSLYSHIELSYIKELQKSQVLFCLQNKVQAIFWRALAMKINVHILKIAHYSHILYEVEKVYCNWNLRLYAYTKILKNTSELLDCGHDAEEGL